MYRTLDPITEGPGATGPTRDYGAILQAMPAYSLEPHQLQPQRLPVQIAVKERPRTSATPIVGLRPSRLPVLVRNSNLRPSEAGEGMSGSTWGVSDPGLYHRGDSGALSAAGDAVPNADGSAPAAGWSLGSQVTARLVLAGIAAGVAFYFWRRNKAQGR